MTTVMIRMIGMIVSQLKHRNGMTMILSANSGDRHGRQNKPVSRQCNNLKQNFMEDSGRQYFSITFKRN
jgi:hypothetical protein